MKIRLLCASLMLAVSCSHGADSNIPADRGDSAIVRIVSISPAAGAEVKVDTFYEATVEYEILDFDPSQRYHLIMQFDSSTAGQSIGPGSGAVEDTEVRDPRGQRTFRAVMADDWLMDRLAKPVRVRFYLTRMVHERRSTVIGRSDVVEYR